MPDPQYLAAPYVCSTGPTGYDNLMRWIVDNRNLPVDGADDSGHLMILRFREDMVPRVVEALALSTVSGRWYGPGGIAPAAGPIHLFSLDFPGVPPGACRIPGRPPIQDLRSLGPLAGGALWRNREPQALAQG